jgi:hypothetical protein
MLKYCDDSLPTIGKKKQRMVKYYCFIWTQEPILKPLVFWSKFGSDKDWVCQLLIEHVNDKSSVTQEEMEYALCWRQSPVVLFPPREKKTKTKIPKSLSNWDLLSSLLFPFCLLFPLAQAPEQNPALPSMLPSLHLHPFQLPAPQASASNYKN